MYQPRIILMIISLVLISGILRSQRVAQASPMAQGNLCFPETPQITHCITGFRSYWQEHGGLPIFGYPISEERSERNRETGSAYTTQWFERNRFEAHPENPAPYHVLLGRLGVDRLRQLARDWESMPKAPTNTPHYFAATGHAIGYGPFWSYWSSHGLEFDGRPGKSYEESLALFGLPLSEPAIETNAFGDQVLTQWFERARFEDHGSKGVLLGLLGNEMRGDATTQSLMYFWPRTIPQGFQIWREGSSATPTSFTLTLTPQVGGPFFAQISGGHGVEVPGSPGNAVTVRGKRGMLYTTGDGFSVYWTEAGHSYMVKYGPGVSDVLALAEDLEAVELATFRTRMEP